MQPALVVTIDTEEEGLWTDRYRAINNTCRNVERLPRLQQLFERVGVRPTWLLDHPVASDETASRILKDLVAGGAGEIGAHMHPWCTPPFYPDGEKAIHSYPHQLAPSRQEAKLRTLCRTIEQNLGVWPRSYRAGRFGFDASTVPVLEQLGFAVDSSVQPLWWDRERGGPDHRRAPQRPYRLDPSDAFRPGASTVVEVPINRVIVGEHGERLESLFRRAPRLPGMRHLMCKLGLGTLSPELHDRDQLLAIAATMFARGLPIFHVWFHSSSALPGATPYVRSARELDVFVDRLQALLDELRSRYDARPLTLTEVPAHFGDPLSSTVKRAAA